MLALVAARHAYEVANPWHWVGASIWALDAVAMWWAVGHIPPLFTRPVDPGATWKSVAGLVAMLTAFIGAMPLFAL